MTESELIKRLALLKKRPDAFKDLAPGELADLVLIVLEYVKQVNKAIQEGRIKGEAGKDAVNPVPDIDYLSLPTARREIYRSVEQAADELRADIRKATESIRNGRDGKDAIVTDEQIRQAANIAAGLIQLPDFSALITAEPQVIRDSLELLRGDERLDLSAIRGLEEVLSELRSRTGSTKILSGKSLLALLSDVSIENPSNGQALVYSSSQRKWMPGSVASGGGEWGDITGTLSDQADLQDALDEKAPLASPTFTGTPVAPTPAAATNTTQIATTAFVQTAVANLINAAPGALDTLDELAAALGDDANFASTVTTSLAGKQPLDATLTALAAYDANGIITQTAPDTFVGRTITGTTNQVNVANGNGVSGQPTLSLPQNIHTAATPQFAKLGLNTPAGTAILNILAGTAGLDLGFYMTGGAPNNVIDFQMIGSNVSTGARQIFSAASMNSFLYFYSGRSDDPNPTIVYKTSHPLRISQQTDYNTGAGYVERWRFDANGHFIAGSDNAYDIGAAGATRPRNVYVAGTGVFGGDVTVPDEAYDATDWNGSLEVPTKNAVRDKIETLAPLITSRARAYNGSAQTIANNTTTKVTLNSESYDSSNEFDSATNYRFTATHAGYYMVVALITFASNTTGVRDTTIKKNSTTNVAKGSNAAPATGGNATRVLATDIVSLTAGDYLEFYCYQDSGGNLDTIGGTEQTYMAVHRLS